MQMVQKSFYIEEDIYQRVTVLAKIQNMPAAALMRGLIKTGIQKEQEKNQHTTSFLLGLADYQMKDKRKNLAKNHDRYAWD